MIFQTVNTLVFQIQYNHGQIIPLAETFASKFARMKFAWRFSVKYSLFSRWWQRVDLAQPSFAEWNQFLREAISWNIQQSFPAMFPRNLEPQNASERKKNKLKFFEPSVNKKDFRERGCWR